MLITLIFLSVLTFLVYKRMSKRPVNFPPGPPRLPLVGSIPYLKDDFFETMKDLKVRMFFRAGKEGII